MRGRTMSESIQKMFPLLIISFQMDMGRKCSAKAWQKIRRCPIQVLNEEGKLWKPCG